MMGYVIVFAILAAVAGASRVHAHYYGAAALARRRLHAGMPVGGEHDAVTLTGTVRVNGPPLRAPLSARPCALYAASAVLRNTRKGLASLLADDDFVNPFVLRKTEMGPFVLATPQGEVLVVGEEPTLAFDPPAPRSWPEQATFAFLGHWSLSDEDCDNVEELRELIVQAGDRISVHGVLTKEALVDGAPSGYRATEQQLCLRGVPNHPLIIGPARD
jgi:hypothetical protein